MKSFFIGTLIFTQLSNLISFQLSKNSIKSHEFNHKDIGKSSTNFGDRMKVLYVRQNNNDEMNAERYKSLGDEIVRQGGVIIRQGDEIESLKVENVRQGGIIIRQGDEIESLKVEIVRQGDEIISLKSDFLEERREKACKEIAFGVQDVNAQSLLETNSIVNMKGLSGVFRSLRESRHDAAHLFRKDDPPDTVIYKKAAFIRILESSNCLKDDLDADGITSDVLAVVLDVLRNELKNVTVRIPKLAEVAKVDKFFKNTLRTLDKRCIEDLC